ncbi:MAG: sigma-70 family RNA polymerase sigma factor [Ginsengibacter sp.]
MLHPETKPINDDLLLTQLQSGSQKSFDVLFDKYWEEALDAAYKRVKDIETAKDIVQDIFTQIWINREIGIENFPAYLHIAIRNRVLKFFAKQKPVHPFFDELENVTEKNFQADSPLLWKEFFQSFEYLINTLPPKRRDIFRLKVQEGLSTKVIASEMGIARKTVQNQLGKAIETLKVSLIRLFTIGILLSFFVS